jgi:filamentous hemagglutinin family protein
MLVFLVLLVTSHVHAQVAPITPSTPSGLNTQVSGPIAIGGQTQYDITGGTRPGGGPNLFHSFGEFGVPPNNIANFLNETPNLETSNILARVTGTNGNNPTLSSIYGTIQTTGFLNANLFLMNPAGFLFGPNATVNVGGMVAFTTSDYLKLTGNARFNAIPNAAADALLTALPVASFGFLGSNPGAITVQGSQFSVTEGSGVSLVGGNISIASGTPEGGTAQPARLSAPNGNILLASAASLGEFDADTLQSLPNVDGASFSSFGSVTLAAGSTIDVSGTSTVSIRGGQFVLSVDNAVLSTAESSTAQESVSLSQGSSLVVATAGTETGPDLRIVSGHVHLDGASVINRITGDSAAGETSITAQTVRLTTGASILSSSEGIGSGSSITLTASESIEISGSDINGTSSRVASEALGDGGGGSIALAAPSITFDQGGAGANVQAFSLGNGPGGDIVINANTLALLGTSGIQTFNFGPSPGGNIRVNGRSITIADGSYIDSVNSGDADGGNIEIRAMDSVSVIGTDPVFGAPSRILTQTDFIGKAGDLTVEAGMNVTVAGGGSIQSVGLDGPSGTISIVAQDTMTITGSFDPSTPSLISNLSLGSGANGGLRLRSKNFLLTEGAQLLTETFDQGGGTISVMATESASLSGGIRITTQSTLADSGSVDITAATILLEQDARINTRTVGPGSAGSITLNATASDLVLSGGSRVRSSIDRGGSGQGGTIVATAVDSVLLSGGSFFNSNTSGSGSAGSITVTAGNVVSIADLGSGLSSETTGSGRGGDITLTAGQSATMTNGSSVSASSTGSGNAGNIDITATNGFTMQNSAITTQAGQGASGGDIKVTTSPEATVWLQNSTISASVADGPGGGGNISIDPQYVILQNSQILAQAAEGQGGKITITTNLFLPDANSIVNADSGSGLHGTVTIQSPNAPASGKIQPLGKTPLQATSLLSQRCAALAGGEFSSFTVAGRDSLPTEPGSWLASPLYAAGVGLGIKAEGMKAEGERLETPFLSLRQIAPPGFLTQAFAVDWSAGCQS